MSTITAIGASDFITNSRTVINTNAQNLNTDKIETSVLDTDTALTANSDSKVATQRAVKAYVDAGGNVNASETTRGISEEATDAEVTAGTATGGTGAKLFITPAKLATYMTTVASFGGTGADGALTVSSGTTNIDLGGARNFIKNYTSISITGTGSITFSNPHANGTYITLRSQGNVTITSSATRAIDGKGMGASFGTPSTGNPSYSLYGVVNGGIGDTNNAAGGVSPFVSLDKNYIDAILETNDVLPLAPGAGGGEGVTDTDLGGSGGASLKIECAGALNFTGTIDVSGNVGLSGAAGGGGGGCVALVYNTLTVNSGTLTVAGGVGNATVGLATQGGGGASLFNSGVAAVQAVGGGNGGAGLGFVLKNKYKG